MIMDKMGKTGRLSDIDFGSIPQTLKYAVGLANGGVVTKPTMAMTGEKGPEAVVPLNAQGREGIGMNDNNKLLEANNRKLDELIAAVSTQRPVLIKSDLERAGFINKAAKVTG